MADDVKRTGSFHSDIPLAGTSKGPANTDAEPGPSQPRHSSEDKQSGKAKRGSTDSKGTTGSGAGAGAAAPPPQQQQPEEPKELDVIAEETPIEIDYDEEWLKSFKWMKLFLIIFGRWPFTYTQEETHRGYLFQFSWTCPGFLVFVLTLLFTLYGLISGGVNVVQVLMKEKIKTGNRTKTEILEQALAERHTIILIIILGSYVINAITSVFIIIKRHEIAETFTKWTRFLYSAKLDGGTYRTYFYVGAVAGNYFFISFVLGLLTLFRTKSTETATLIGGPTVVAMLFMRHFNSADYLDNFVGSSTHHIMHYVGILVMFYVVTTCHAYMYLFLWLLKSVENAFACWNERMAGVLDLTLEEVKAQTSTKERTSYETLYHDHIGLVRMLTWLNNMFAYCLEPYVLFLTIRIVYQLYLAAIVVETNGKPVTKAQLGKYFVRKGDYYPALLLTFENCATLLGMLLASSWLEDVAYESYDDLRKKSLLKGAYGDRESFFFLSMFQSYTSTTKMAIYGGHFFCIDRYSVLHVLSAIMSNFLVVYQFRPLFDMDTVGSEFDDLRKMAGAFFQAFEGLPLNHTVATKM